MRTVAAHTVINMNLLALNFIIMWIYVVKNEADNRLEEKYFWKTIDYDFVSPEARDAALGNGFYKPENNFISSLEIWRDVLFLTVPRLRKGVPSTLNYIYINDAARTPKLKPFPSWDANYHLNKTLKNSTMTSVHSVRVEHCNRLWALDSGIYNELEENRVEDSPALYIYNLIDKQLIRRHSLEAVRSSSSKLRNIIVDINASNCGTAFAYIADSKYGLIVYSWESNQSYRMSNNYFSFEPIWGNFKTSNGNLYQINDGILGMALSVPNKEGFRELFFQPLAGVLEYRISTNILKNKTMNKDAYKRTYLLGDRGNHMQSSASFLDLNTGVMFYTTIIKNGIACWNSFRGDDIKPENQGIINEFNENMAYPADIKVDSNNTMWVLTNKMLDFLYEKEQTLVPYHIYAGPVKSLINNTPCKII